MRLASVIVLAAAAASGCSDAPDGSAAEAQAPVPMPEAAALPAPAVQSLPPASAAPVLALRVAAAATPQPYAVVGTWSERGHTVVYLKAHGRVVTVDGPGALDPTYDVASVDLRGVVLRERAGGTLVMLPLDGRGSSASPTPGTRPAPARAPAAHETANGNSDEAQSEN